MKPILLLIMLLVLFSHIANGQVKTSFNNAEIMTSKGKFGKNFQAKSPRTIPAKDIKSLLEKEAKEGNLGEAKPFKIAEAVRVDIDVIKEAAWVEEAGFAHGKYTIVANGAKSISANFDRFKLPKGTELYVYSANGEMITGPVTENENNENNFWGTWVYKGGSLTIDFKTPVETKSELKLHISSVAYGYKDIYRQVNNFGESSLCNINVVCAPIGTGWENERNSVSLILDANSTALCSGALINNTCNLNIPYLLTANHCFNTIPQQNVAQWKFTFQAWSPICDRLQQQNANGVTFNGSTLRANNAGSDFCLVELTQLPPANSGITFSGWSRNTVGIQNTTIIHHPAGDVMKISRDDQAPVFATFLGSQEWQLVLDQGATNGGSSGAPYYDQNHRIIAQHHGINQNNLDQCLNTNKFGGRFDISWTGGGTNATRLSNWLDPSNSGAMTTNTISLANAIPNPASATITNISTVCSINTFTINNNTVPLGTIWASSNPSGLSIDANGLATRVNNFNGQVTVSASICGSAVPPVSVWVGAVNASDIEFGYLSTYPYVCPNTTQSVVLQPAFTGFTYEIGVLNGTYAQRNPPNFYWVYIGNYTPSQYVDAEITARINSGCGWSDYKFLPLYSDPISCPPGGGCEFGCLFSVSPNPGNEEINVEVNEEEWKSAKAKRAKIEYQLVLKDDGGKEHIKIKTKEKSTKLDTRNIPQGTYYLQVEFDKTVITKRVIISK